MTVLMWTLGLLFFLLVLAFSIGIHEAGHMVVAKLFKLEVPKFFVGFGKTIWSFKTKKTEYGFKVLPIGGFVQIFDKEVKEPDLSHLEAKIENPDITDEEKKQVQKEIKKAKDNYIAESGLLSNVAPWKRILIYLAGPAVNLVLGTVIIFVVLMNFSSMVVENTVNRVNACSTISAGESCEAEKAGIQAGDKIIAVEGKEYATADNFSPALQGKDEVAITLERDGKIIETTSGIENGYLGVDLTLNYRPLSFGESVDKIQEVMVSTVVSLAHMPEKVPGLVETTVTGSERDPEAPSSVVNAGKTYGDTAADMEIENNDKIQMLLLYSGLLNLSLAFLNFLPILPLDGGRVLIALVDQFKIIYAKLFRKKYMPVNAWQYTVVTAVSAAFVFSFMGLLIVSDIAGIMRGQL